MPRKRKLSQALTQALKRRWLKRDLADPQIPSTVTQQTAQPETPPAQSFWTREDATTASQSAAEKDATPASQSATAPSQSPVQEDATTASQSPAQEDATTASQCAAQKDATTASQPAAQELYSAGIYCRSSPVFDDLFGFSVEDVKDEVKRGKRLVCDVCKRTGATSGCEVKRCKKSFHYYPCSVRGAQQDVDEHKGTYLLYCNKHSQERAAAARTIPAVAGPSNHITSDSSPSSGVKRRMSTRNKQDGPSKQKRRIYSESDEDTSGPPMQMFAPIESDSDGSVNMEHQDSTPGPTRDGGDIPVASSSGNHLHRCQVHNNHDDDDDATQIESDVESASLLQPVAYFVGTENGSQLLQLEGYGQSPGTRLGFPVGPDRHTANGPTEPPSPVLSEPPSPVRSEPPFLIHLEPPSPVLSEPPSPVRSEPLNGPTDPPSPVPLEPPSPVPLEPPSPVPLEPPSPVRPEPPNVSSQPPRVSSPVSATAHVDTVAPISPPPPPPPSSPPPFPVSLPSATPPSPGPEPSCDPATFWMWCNEAGCTRAIFSDFIAEMNNLSNRVQSGQASQEDYSLSLRVMEASGRLPELVAKQEEDLKKRQEELQAAVEAMRKARTAFKR